MSYKRLLSFTIESKNRLVNQFGFNLAFFGFLLFYLVILSGISKYDSSILSVMWGLAYLSNLFLDLVVYSIIVQAMIFYVILKYKDNKIITVQKLNYLENMLILYFRTRKAIFLWKIN